MCAIQLEAGNAAGRPKTPLIMFWFHSWLSYTCTNLRLISYRISKESRTANNIRFLITSIKYRARGIGAAAKKRVVYAAHTHTPVLSRGRARLRKRSRRIPSSRPQPASCLRAFSRNQSRFRLRTAAAKSRDNGSVKGNSKELLEIVRQFRRLQAQEEGSECPEVQFSWLQWTHVAFVL